MPDLKIVPTAANACAIEVYLYKGQAIGWVLAGVLEINAWELSGSARLSILRREQDFAKFNVFDDAIQPKPKLLGSTHSIDIEFPK